jgi:hypothetical protein
MRREEAGMWIVWITVGAATLAAVVVWASLLPACRGASPGWRLLSASGIPLSVLGINFVIRFWNPTPGPYLANHLYPFGDHLHAWAVSFGFTWLAFGLLFAVLALLASRDKSRLVWAALLAGWFICWLPHGVIGLAFAWAGGSAPSVETYSKWSSEPQGFILLLFNALALLAHFGLSIVGFVMTGLDFRRDRMRGLAAGTGVQRPA